MKYYLICSNCRSTNIIIIQSIKERNVLGTQRNALVVIPQQIIAHEVMQCLNCEHVEEL